MKYFGVLVLIFFATVQSDASGFSFLTICTGPGMDGNWSIYVANDKTSAVVFYNEEEFPVIDLYMDGPIISFTYDNGFMIQKLIYSADQGINFRNMIGFLKKYRKVFDISCHH